MGLKFINNSFRSLRRQHIHFKEVGIMVSGNQVVKAVELKTGQPRCFAKVSTVFHSTLRAPSAGLVCNCYRYCTLR